MIINEFKIFKFVIGNFTFLNMEPINLIETNILKSIIVSKLNIFSIILMNNNYYSILLILNLITIKLFSRTTIIITSNYQIYYHVCITN